MVVGLLAVFAVMAIRAGGDGDGPEHETIDGVTRFSVELDHSVDHPGGEGEAAGATVALLADTVVVVVASGVNDRFAVRFTNGEGRQSDWVPLEHQLDEGPDRTYAEGQNEGLPGGEGGPVGNDLESSIRALAPLLVDPAATGFELVRLAGDGGDPVVALLAADGDGNPGIDNMPSVAGAQQLLATQVASGPPTIMPRSSWTDQGWASGNSGCSSGPSYSSNIQAVVVHHTVNANTYRPDQVDDLLRAIRYSHVEVNGWCDVGYNFIVDRFGTVWEGRSGGADRPVIGGHAKGFNTSAVGIALLGQHQQGASPASATPAEVSQQAIVDVATWKLGLHGVDPQGTTWLKNRSSSGQHRLTSGQWHLVPTVLAHRDLGLTACPGSLTLPFVRSLGQRVAANGVANVSYRFGGWTPFSYGPGFVMANSGGVLSAAGSASIPGMGAASPAAGGGSLPAPSAATVAVAATRNGGSSGGYILSADGVVHPYGAAPAAESRPAGDRPAVDIVSAADGGGWVITADGAAVGFGGRSDLAVAAADSVAPIIRGDLDARGDGYLVDAGGRLRAVGSAPAAQAGSGGVSAVDVAVRPSGDSGWVVTTSGTLHAFGGAPAVTVSSPGGFPPVRTVKAVVSAANGKGGWILSAEGQLWPFGGQRLVFPLFSDAGGAAVADVAFAGSSAPPELTNSETGRYLNSLGTLFLGRAMSGDEIEYWDGWLAFHGGHREMALELARSPAWAGNRIDTMYRDVLGRSPDSAGLDYWLAQVRSGLRLDHVGIYFYGSTEYVATSGSTSAYVERLYQRLLERGSDPSGLAYWVEQLDSGRAEPQDLTAGFYLSPESRKQRVRRLYLDILGREPDQAGGDYWVQRLTEVDDVELAAELAASSEYYQRTVR